MKNFQKTINGVTYKGKAFEEDDILNKLGRTKNEWELVDKYQKTFPQLLLDNDKNDFVVDGEILWRELGKPQGEFRKFYNRKIIDVFTENVDYKKELVIPKKINEDILVDVKNMNQNQLSRYGISENYILTIEVAKSLSLGVGTTAKSSEEVRDKGNLVRKYFILIEKILKDYDKWTMVREPQKDGWNVLEKSIDKWCIRSGYDHKDRVFHSREANMLNVALTGCSACELNIKNKVKDKKTRDNLQLEVNKALSELQIIDKALIDSNMDFDTRKVIIENTCKITYAKIKDLI